MRASLNNAHKIKTICTNNARNILHGVTEVYFENLLSAANSLQLNINMALSVAVIYN